jgi:hypothetical protein
MKKILLGVAAIATAVALVPLLAAFEAHVVNVTATIENALFVHPASRKFGTVFPQEHLEQGIFVTFSESFSDEDQERVGTVKYKIVQKPKPLPEYEEQVGVTPAREWCHDNYPQTPFDANDPAWQAYLTNCFPSLCPYLSKEPDNNPSPGNDTGVPPFHDPFATSSIATGRINKFGTDVGDNWIIDLAVPCFEGQCSQDWPDFVHSHNPQANPDDYVLPPELEHEVFGCNLWFEVTDIF